MSQVTIFDPNNVVTVINASPPTDQTAQVAALTAQVAALQAKLAAVKGDLDKAETDAA